MAIIESVRQKTKNGVFAIYIESDADGRSYLVRRNTYLSLGSPTKGAYISDECLEFIAGEDEHLRAIDKALSLIEASDKSKRTLLSRLVMAGFSRGAAEAAVDECQRLGYIDDLRLLTRLIEREANASLRGRAYICRKLIAKGFSRDDVSIALNSLIESGEVDFDANFEVLCQRRGAETDEERRLLAFKYGYRIYP